MVVLISLETVFLEIMKAFHIILLIIVIFFLSCEKEKYDNLEIATGSICGWCTGSDSLSISAEKTVYQYSESCLENHSVNRQTHDKDWDKLIELLDLREFEEIELNTCFSCVDGCDTWICITHDSGSHQISFAFFDSAEIRDIRPFIDKLEEIRGSLRQEIQN
jgi:hypothetical protein